MPTGLYGLEHSNRSVNDHWGKNCFNSSFPAAMASYMMDHDVPAIYIKLADIDGKLQTISSTISLRNVFNCGTSSASELSFNFESIFTPYQQYSFDTIDPIDLVVKNHNGQFLSPLEVKLTVLPTDSTSRQSEDKWGCELVVRSATTSYCALGMFDAVKDDSREVRDIFESSCSSI